MSSPVIPTDRRTSVYAVLSFVLGLTWWFWVGSILAVVLGHVARAEVRDEGRGGDTLAIFGLVMGYLGIFTLGLVILVRILN